MCCLLFQMASTFKDGAKDSFLWSLIGSLIRMWSWMNGSVTSLSLGLLSKHCGSHSSLFKELKCVNCPFDRNTSTCDFSICIWFGIKMNFQSIQKTYLKLNLRHIFLCMYLRNTHQSSSKLIFVFVCYWAWENDARITHIIKNWKDTCLFNWISLFVFYTSHNNKSLS